MPGIRTPRPRKVIAILERGLNTRLWVTARMNSVTQNTGC